MSKFFTYEERLDLQKFLKDSLSFKEMSRRLRKNPTRPPVSVSSFSRENNLEKSITAFDLYNNAFGIVNSRYINVCNTYFQNFEANSVYQKLVLQEIF